MSIDLVIIGEFLEEWFGDGFSRIEWGRFVIVVVRVVCGFLSLLKGCRGM